MPELPVTDVRLPELHLPEIDRDQIVRSLSEIRLPEIDLSTIDLPKLELPDFDLPKIDRPSFDLSSIDIGKALAGAAALLHIGRPAARRRSRSRWSLAIGVAIVAGLASWALLSNPTARERIGRSARGLRQRIDARQMPTDILEIDADDPIAFTAAETAPIVSAAYDDGSGPAETGYPDGLGIGDDGTSPVIEAGHEA
jgi:hypothetical protein